MQVKSTLDKASLKSAFSNVESAKNLAKVESGGLEDGRVIQTSGYIFGYKSAISLKAVADHYFGLIESDGLGVHPDMIVVLNRGIISLVTQPPGSEGWGPLFVDGVGRRPDPQWQVGVAVYEVGDHCLDLFFRLMLPHLSLFRHLVDHPGFDWTKHVPAEGFPVRPLGRIVGGTMFNQDGPTAA